MGKMGLAVGLRGLLLALGLSLAGSGLAREAMAFPTPQAYARQLGKGLDVDWAKTRQGQAAYSTQAVKDFRARGLGHVRIRVKDDLDPELLGQLDTIIGDCVAQGLAPVLAYQADGFKKNPSDRELAAVVDWWSRAARHFQQASPLLSFDLLIEATDALNHAPDRLNALYEQTVSAIRASNPRRILFISPRLRSDPAYLKELALPSQHNHQLMAEWHFYAAGPDKSNPRKRWRGGGAEDQQLIRDKIQQAVAWQRQTGIPTWVGAWMPGNYNDGNDFSIDEQVAFARFVAGALDEAGIPFAVNSDTKFYDREAQRWIAERAPVLDAILQPGSGAKPKRR